MEITAKLNTDVALGWNIHEGTYDNGTVQKHDGAMYIHVQHPAYGEYSHLIIVGAREVDANAIGNNWANNRPVTIEYKFDRCKNEPTKHTVGMYKEHTLR
jgi:hypothetical protein